MTANSQKEKPPYRQEAFNDHALDRGDAMERLRKQWVAVGQLEWPMTLANHDALRKAAGDIDTNLIRFAIRTLQDYLEEAAIRDTGRLIAERVLDTSEAQEALKRWEAWLDAAPFWPALAKENWAEAVRQAAWLVVETLSESGVKLDATAQAELAEQVGRLEIEDLLPKTMIERFFPTSREEREW